MTTIKVRRDTAANWASTNPVLADGERGYDKTNKVFKTGDGVTAWASLPIEHSGTYAQLSDLLLRGDDRIRAMAASPPWSPPVMASAPTITESTTQDAALTKSWSQTLTSVFRFDGPTTGGLGSTPRYYTLADSSGVAASVPSTQLFFDTDADKLQVVFFGRSSAKYRVWVNEKVTTASWTSVTTNSATSYITIDFGSYSSAPRRIVFEMELSANPIQFFGVRTKPAAMVLPSSLRGPRFMVIGDSYGTGTGADMLASGWARTLGRMLGFADTWSNFTSVGSTGLVAAPSSTVGNYKSRLAGDVIPYAPDYVLIQTSLNDEPHIDLGLIGPALIDYVTTLKAALPQCVVEVTSLLQPYTPSTNRAKITAETKAAAATLGIPYYDVFSPVAYFAGTGSTTAPASDGNADRYANGSATLHPSKEGHWAIASVLASMIAQRHGTAAYTAS